MSLNAAPLPEHLRTRFAPTDHLLLMLGLVVLWTLTHRYLSLMLDGELYGVQALARLRPALANDLYLANTSQDQFTLFSPLYAAAIGQLGLQPAGCLLFVACRVAFLTGAWCLMAQLTSRPLAWLAAGAVVCTVAPYGAFGIFESASDYLTARTVAEALVLLALAAYLRSRLLAAGLIAAAFLMHPLMTMPGLLLLVFLSVPARVGVGLFAAGVVSVGLLALATSHGLLHSRLLVVMNPAWLEVVRERSQFLFLNYWKVTDWKIQARPFLSLALAYGCLGSQPLRRLCLGAGVVGAAGLMVAAIGGGIGPIAILVQGQAWRWMWVTGLVAIFVAVPTAWQLWRSPRCGRLCAVLLVAGWAFPPVDPNMCIAAAGVLWLLNGHVGAERDRLLKYAAYLLIGIMALWTLSSILHPEMVDTRHATLAIRAGEWLRGAFSLQAVSLSLFAGLMWLVARRHPGRWAAAVTCILLLTLSLPTLISGTGAQAVSERNLVTEWRNAIPEDSNVLLLPLHKTASFLWFTLERPSYLTLSQSAGVVFSAATAAEVRRRSGVLKPVADPDWRISSRIEAADRHQTLPESSRPLTADALQQICVDTALGFVVSRETVGFEPLTNNGPGRWKGWNLYDCRRVRGTAAHS